MHKTKALTKNILLLTVVLFSLPGCATTSNVHTFNPSGAPLAKKNVFIKLNLEDKRAKHEVGYVGESSGGTMIAEPPNMVNEMAQSLGKQFSFYGYDISESDNDLAIHFDLDWIHIEHSGTTALIYMKAHITILDHKETVLDDFYEVREPFTCGYKLDASAAVDTGLQALAKQIITDLDTYIQT